MIRSPYFMDLAVSIVEERVREAADYRMASQSRRVEAAPARRGRPSFRLLRRAFATR